MSKKRRTQLDIWDELFQWRMRQIEMRVEKLLTDRSEEETCEWVTEFDRKRNSIEFYAWASTYLNYQPFYKIVVEAGDNQSWVNPFKVDHPKPRPLKLKIDPRLPSHYQKQKVYCTAWAEIPIDTKTGEPCDPCE